MAQRLTTQQSSSTLIPRRRIVAWSIFATTGCLSWACTPSHDGVGPRGLSSAGTLQIAPTLVDVDLTDGADKTVSFRAISAMLGDVTRQATWYLSDSSVGVVDAGKLTVQSSLRSGGVFLLHAATKEASGSARVRVKVRLPDVLDESAPTDSKDYFSGDPSGPALSFLYPFDNTMVAPNVVPISLMWRAGSGQRIFKLVATGPTYQRTFYVGAGRCQGERCVYSVDDRVWASMAYSSPEETVTWTIFGVADKDTAVGQSNPVAIRFSPGDVHGGLYFFSPSERAIKKIPIGARRAADFMKGSDDAHCAGCHALSRDGRKIAVKQGSSANPRGSLVLSAATASDEAYPLSPSIVWDFAWFNPTGDKLITNWRGQLTLRSATTGEVLQQVKQEQVGGAFGGAMPEWSPDGKWIAFVRNLLPSSSGFELNGSGDIVVMPYNRGVFGNGITLVKGDPKTEVHIWPSWTPDSKWLVFNTQICGGGCQSYDALLTRIRLVRAISDSGEVYQHSQPVELLAGTHAAGNHNNWPKVAPFLQSGRYAFVTYSATYGWGFNEGKEPQLFMFGVDLEKAGISDPSYQPLWLPFQDPNVGNHSAIWTTDVACARQSDCPAEFMCVAGICAPKVG